MGDVAITGVLPSFEGRPEKLAALFGYQDTFQCHFMIADYQALARTGLHGNGMNRAIQATVERFLAEGFDPERSICFLQSTVPQLSELTMIFSNLVTLTDLLSKHIRKRSQMPNQTSLGVVGYPVSQVADILMFGGSLRAGSGSSPRKHRTRTGRCVPVQRCLRGSFSDSGAALL